VRVGEHAAIEHPVGVERDAVLVGERFEQQGERARAQADEVADPVLQHARLQLARVDALAERRDARQQRALAFDRL
jgi:hypothetical protein